MNIWKKRPPSHPDWIIPPDHIDLKLALGLGVLCIPGLMIAFAFVAPREIRKVKKDVLDLPGDLLRIADFGAVTFTTDRKKMRGGL